MGMGCEVTAVGRAGGRAGQRRGCRWRLIGQAAVRRLGFLSWHTPNRDNVLCLPAGA